MKHVSILVPKGALMGSIEGPRQVFTEVNKFLKSIERPLLCTLQLVGFHKEVPVCGGRYKVFTDVMVSDVEKTDLIIIPAVDGDMPSVLEENKAFLPWIVEQHNKGAEV